MVEEDSLTKLLQSLQDPAPQYVLGCVPAIATIGAAPDNGLTNKLLWILRCLGCPFTGLFYTCNIGSDPIAMSTYWLTSDHFMKDGYKIPYRPFGHYTMKIAIDEQDNTVVKLLRECIAEASVLDRLSSLASAYYIFLGIFSGITKAIRIGQCTGEDWPYLPLALAWTFPAIYRRVSRGRMVVNDPRQVLGNMYLVVRDLPHNERSSQDAQVLITFVLFSVIIPWMSVLLAYFTRPVGYGCRAKYLTVLSSIWSFNSFIAYISHISGEKFVGGNRYVNGWFCLCGVIISMLLILLGLLSHTKSWWGDLFGEKCSVTCIN
ncbi:unnamed protein product [Rhizophagus irregularis]|uniref:Uncharacterized protein n=1 Tax=Rhizophagus irregularis TaxID=588596 RepID=A0A2I1H1L7_9GLOM|nr:hypothetical protein RhiirA4_425539 [Rhizophagus irregularis]CAB4411669.1 unnamed protein product [Rhizophagus irregularis]CAB4412410.1 unnamed protein product [Rhizophagus irregularis]